MTDASLRRFLDRLSDCVADGTLLSVVFSAPRAGDAEAVRGSLRQIAGKRVLQLEFRLTEGRVRHQNVEAEELEQQVTSLFSVFRNSVIRHRDGGSGTLLTSKNGKMTYTEDARLRRTAEKGSTFAPPVPLPENDRQKDRLLTGKESFLRKLGISDETGRVHDRKQAKYRQVCRFCEQVRDIMKELPAEGTLRVADLCSGKSYLSFAVYYCLRELFHREVEMTCVDLKESVMDECRVIAGKLGYTGMTFLCSDIDAYRPAEHPHLVISLHACDTATDIVLRYAVSRQADVILSTPCCHRALSRQVQCPQLSFITDYPMLCDKFCTAATDGLRLLFLRCHGYRTDAIELIDPEDTPKNILLRGVRDPRFNPCSQKAEALRRDYAAAYRFLTGNDPAEVMFAGAGQP